MFGSYLPLAFYVITEEEEDSSIGEQDSSIEEEMYLQSIKA